MTTNDPDIENAIRALRDAFSRKINVKDSEIITLRGECAAKDSEIKELQLRIAQLENQLLKADNRISDMSKSVSKLTSFKQQILESIADDDLSSLRGALGRERMSDQRNISIGSEFEKGVRLSSPQSDQSYLDQHRFGNNSSFLNDISTTSTFQPSSNRQYSSANLNSSTSTPARTSASPTFLATTRFPPQKLPTPSKQILGFDSISTSHRRQHLNNQGGRSPTNGTTYPNCNRSETNSPQAETQESANPRRPQSSASNPSSPQAVDGREFFRIARQTLSYDEFTILLWNVKAYNNREQTRQKTIENLNILLGTKHKSLFERFEKLLMNGSSNSSAK